jgi:hypothetical protein
MMAAGRLGGTVWAKAPDANAMSIETVTVDPILGIGKTSSARLILIKLFVLCSQRSR